MAVNVINNYNNNTQKGVDMQLDSNNQTSNNLIKSNASKGSAPVKKLVSNGTKVKDNTPLNEGENSFILEKAITKALKVATSYVNSVLDEKNMHVELEKQGEEFVGKVFNKNTGEHVSIYDGVQLLKLYAQNQKEKGIVVDGQV